MNIIATLLGCIRMVYPTVSERICPLTEWTVRREQRTGVAGRSARGGGAPAGVPLPTGLPACGMRTMTEPRNGGRGIKVEGGGGEWWEGLK